MRYRYVKQADGKTVKKALVYTADEHRINPESVDKDAVYIVRCLQNQGHETYIVGGAVRDLMMGKIPKDFDIVTDANPSKIKKVFRNSRIIGRRFRLVHVYFGPKIFEVSTFRSLKDGPTSNTYGTIEEDVLRRDFTVNAFFYDPLKELVVDYVGGMKDIKARRIRPIIPLDLIFKDDPVRMIRAAKYGAATGCALPLTLRWKIKKDAPLLKSVSSSRLGEEINKIITSPHAPDIVKKLDSLGLYGYLQPRAAELFRTKPLFREQYLKGLEARGSERLPGEALSSLVRDYLENALDWESAGPESFKEALLAARSFVLPMNPPRAGMELAVRLIFREHGITVRKYRLQNEGEGRRRRRGPGRSKAPE
ncbi:MAG: polynucleotide adenylyltransferase PcnB [Spirochaetaceae bacterium]|nr:polynucleotide adenylyltransferase PcnB [Spirochaetaceae bacterium]